MSSMAWLIEQMTRNLQNSGSNPANYITIPLESDISNQPKKKDNKLKKK